MKNKIISGIFPFLIFFIPFMGAQSETLKKVKVAPKVCLKLAKQSRPLAEQCLQMSDREKRAKCFASIGVMINKEAPNDICEFSLEPIKQEFVQKEKKLYPTQDPALK